MKTNNQNQNKGTFGGEHCFICKEETVGQTCYRIHVECATPPSKSSSWEEEVYRACFNAEMGADMVRFIQSLLASEREKVLNELLESLPKERTIENENSPKIFGYQRVGAFNQALSEIKKVVEEKLKE